MERKLELVNEGSDRSSRVGFVGLVFGWEWEGKGKRGGQGSGGRGFGRGFAGWLGEFETQDGRDPGGGAEVDVFRPGEESRR